MTSLKVAEVLFSKVYLLAFLLVLQVEFYFYLCYNPVIFLSKVLKVTKLNQTSLVNQNLNHPYCVILILSILGMKGGEGCAVNLLLLACIFFWKLSSVLDKFPSDRSVNNSIYLVLSSFGIFLVFLFFIQSFLVFLFFIELYGVMYYFLFLTSYSFTSQTLLKYKNGLLLLLWNNFLTTLFLSLGCFMLMRFNGSTNFYELSFLNVNALAVYTFLLGLCWKLGFPIFHFFKLEVYKYLLKENVFLFSTLTTVVNITLLYICFTQPVIFQSIYLYNFLFLVLIFAILLLILNLKLTNFLQFFALSGAFTLTTIVSVFLV